MPDANLFAVALSGTARYELETEYPIRFGLTLSVAPDITTFDDADGLVDALVRAEVQLGENASAFVGYRLLEADLKRGGDHEIDDGLHIGIRLAF